MHGCSGGHAWLLPGGMHGCYLEEGGCMHGFIRGHVWFYLGGHVWFYLGGHAWFYSGGMCGFILGGMVLFGGGTCVVFSVFPDTMRYGQ